MLRKKSQSYAATVIGIIALLLIAYILFLPPEEREELLEGEDYEATGIAGAEGNVTVLNATALRLEYVGEDEFQHNIPNVYLSEKTEASILESVAHFNIRNGWFDKESNEISFYIEDLENTDNVALSLLAPESKGNLIISLNGVQVFDYEATRPNIGPIEFKKELLKEGENTAELSVGGVGIRFWTTNEYSIENLQIIADIRDISQQQSMNIFTITNDEYYNIESAYVEFFPVCDPQDVGRLKVNINNLPVYSAVPDCNMLTRFDIFTKDINAGKNTVSFSTDKGSYRIEHIKVVTKLKEVKTFFEYFEINSSMYDDLLEDERDAWVVIEFVDDGERKRAELNINGHVTFIDQTKPLYDKRVTHWIEEGTRNYMEIKPLTVLRIAEARVVLAES